jgi:hypothetical protein
MLYSWQEPYLSALLETEKSKLYARILEVRSAFEQRLLSPIHDEELRAMSVAASVLDMMERKGAKAARRFCNIRLPNRKNPRARNPAIQ